MPESWTFWAGFMAGLNPVCAFLASAPSLINEAETVTAIIPTFILLGPIALLAALLPVVFAGLAFFLRRWLVLLSIASLDSTLYLTYAWLRSHLIGSWWGSPAVLY